MTSPSEGRNEEPQDDPLTMEEVFRYVRDDLDQVERVLRDGLQSDVPLIGHVGKYVFESGGKRMRPLLTILSLTVPIKIGRAHV